MYGQADAVAAVGLDTYDTYSATPFDPTVDRDGLAAAVLDRLPGATGSSTSCRRLRGAPERTPPAGPAERRGPRRAALAGRYEVLSGRAPTSPARRPAGDIAGDLGLTVGDDLELLSRGTVRVTGIVAWGTGPTPAGPS